MNDWSVKSIQDLIIEENEDRKRTSIYASDYGKCPTGIFLALKGEKPTSPKKPRSIRRMEIGKMLEIAQVNKLKSLGVLIMDQDRIYDEEYNVSGRPDAVIINPEECTPRAKNLIFSKQGIWHDLQHFESEENKLTSLYEMGEVEEGDFFDRMKLIDSEKISLLREDRKYNLELLEPDPKNSLMLVEIKSIVEKGFKWRQKENKPMEDHSTQCMFYLWKLRIKYPWMLGRILYVDTSYQDLLEFNVDLDLGRLKQMQGFWKMINDSVKNDTPPSLIPSVVLNPMSHRWQVNMSAQWCDYHIKCTGDANWANKAFDEAAKLNGKK